MGQVGGASEGLTSAVVLAIGIAVYWIWALYSGKIDSSTLAQLHMVAIRVAIAHYVLLLLFVLFQLYMCQSMLLLLFVHAFGMIALCVMAGVHVAIDVFIAICVSVDIALCAGFVCTICILKSLKATKNMPQEHWSKQLLTQEQAITRAPELYSMPKSKKI